MSKFRAYADGQMYECLEDWWWYIGDDNGYWSLNDDYGNIICDSLESKNPKLMQYIGLKDKNGIELCDGDIVDYYNPEDKDGVFVVEFAHGCFTAMWKIGTIKKTNSMTPMCYLACPDEMEVIGNIYENPSLLAERN